MVTLENYGGSGNFRLLNLVLNRAGRLENTDRVPLGDRIRLVTLAVAPSGRILVTYLDRAPEAPYSDPPTIRKTAIFQVKKGKLVRVKEGGDGF